MIESEFKSGDVLVEIMGSDLFRFIIDEVDSDGYRMNVIFQGKCYKMGFRKSFNEVHKEMVKVGVWDGKNKVVVDVD